MESKRAEAIGQFDLFGGQPGDDSGVGLFDVPVPSDQWDTKHQLALEREMLGLYVSGHPLRGMEHILARQADTPIPSILEGTVAAGIEVLFFPKTYSVVGVNVTEDTIVLAQARVAKRDARISLIANDLVVPGLGQASGPAGIGPGQHRTAGDGQHAGRTLHP